ncbi:MAG: ABC transporter ATP-binding protein [Acidobacteriota bacterium]|nr:ABC transporter ATP-binding protein [Acidobacteriota bacterium]
MSRPIVEASGLTKVFPMPAGPVAAVTDVDLTIGEGESVTIQGPSGCGKSTLLHLIGCVERASHGSLRIDGRDVSSLRDAERSRLRLTRLGFVFQRFFLLPMLTARENVELPQAEAGIPRGERRERTIELLSFVGLAERAEHRPSQLSGGEMQRVAIARALANRPALLLADEPTGELDEATGAQIAELLDRVHREGTTVVVVTHDPAIAARARRRLSMRSGRIEESAGDARPERAGGR